MDQVICASLSRTHYWYEVGMLKIPAYYTYYGVYSEDSRNKILILLSSGGTA